MNEWRMIATHGSHAASSFAVQGEAPRQASAPLRESFDVDCRRAGDDIRQGEFDSERLKLIALETDMLRTRAAASILPAARASCFTRCVQRREDNTFASDSVQRLDPLRRTAFLRNIYTMRV